MPEWCELWWTSFTGPKSLCTAAARSLYNCGNVCLIVPDDLPWRNEMRACILTEMHQFPDLEDFYVELIDVNDECADATDVGRYLLERYALPAVASGYRQRNKMQQYIMEHRVLKSRVLWVKGMNPQQEKRWLQFCREYYPTSPSDGRFVLELRWTEKENERRNLAVIRYAAMIHSYDLSLFSSLYLNSEKRNYLPVWQQYASTLCSLLCGTDAETAQALIESCDFTCQEPMVGLRLVAAAYQRRGSGNDAHILSLVRRESMLVIEQQIWKAQLQVLFPLIEMERISFVEKYRDQIRQAIREPYFDYRTERTQQIYQFGEPLSEPDHAELGTLYRMTKLRRGTDNAQYLLYLPDEKTRQHIELLHELRNALAHGRACAVDKVAEFINAHPYVWL